MKLGEYKANFAAATRRFGKARNKPEPLEQKNRHMKIYRDRKKLGLQKVAKPWDYLTSLEVKDMAWQAYRVASWYMLEGLFDTHLTHQQLRESFANLLAENFTDALLAHAAKEGECFPVDDETPPYRNYARVWEMLAGDVPASWRPEYPLYPDIQKLTPASAANASGAVITADEGNGNAYDSRP